jgi:hypothetical protein
VRRICRRFSAATRAPRVLQREARSTAAISTARKAAVILRSVFCDKESHPCSRAQFTTRKHAEKRITLYLPRPFEHLTPVRGTIQPQDQETNVKFKISAILVGVLAISAAGVGLARARASQLEQNDVIVTTHVHHAYTPYEKLIYKNVSQFHKNFNAREFEKMATWSLTISSSIPTAPYSTAARSSSVASPGSSARFPT